PRRCCMTCRPSNLTDSLPPGRWRIWWPNCKLCVVKSNASHRAHRTWPTISANCLVIEGRVIRAPSQSGSIDERKRAAGLGCLITRCGDVITVADRATKASVDVAAYIAAIVLAGAADVNDRHDWRNLSDDVIVGVARNVQQLLHLGRPE